MVDSTYRQSAHTARPIERLNPNRRAPADDAVRQVMGSHPERQLHAIRRPLLRRARLLHASRQGLPL